MRTNRASALLQGAKDIRVALAASGPSIADRLSEKYPPPEGEDGPLFDYGLQVEHLIHELESAEGTVVAAEDAHMKQEVRVSRLRTERDQKAEESYDKLLAARQGFSGLQGVKGDFETVFVSGKAPRRPRKLAEQMEQSVSLLNEPAVEPRSSKIAGFAVDYSAVAKDLEAKRLELSEVIGRLDDQNKRAEITMLARREAIDELQRTVIWAGRSAEGLFERAGENELAKRIRTSTRRPPRPSEQKPSEETAGDSPSDESPVADEALDAAASESSSDVSESSVSES